MNVIEPAGRKSVDEARRQGLREWRGLCNHRYTYTRWAKGGGWLLYDNQADPCPQPDR